ncbi:hypothetical protein GUJ93_ZPchr0006g45983 [Zizania palustris]|uniref:Uncharacterized protein n=1 Tax=Zizania palustris TaxID=103762 RepID=A0A8J5W239_ZIZPA|nr:hypothetical protein GUJ93_ZPchr0006g45983 [Zizania palustris]
MLTASPSAVSRCSAPPGAVSPPSARLCHTAHATSLGTTPPRTSISTPALASSAPAPSAQYLLLRRRPPPLHTVPPCPHPSPDAPSPVPSTRCRPAPHGNDFLPKGSKLLELKLDQIMVRPLRWLRNLNLQQEEEAEPIENGQDNLVECDNGHANLPEHDNDEDLQSPPDVDGLLPRLPR